MEPKVWVTYRMADGSMINGTYAFVDSLDHFEAQYLDDPIKIIKETWVLEDREAMILEPEDWCLDEWEEWYDEDE